MAIETGTKKRIMIVDNNHDNLKDAQYILGKEYTVDTALSATEMFTEFNAGRVPDLILLDADMPEMDGFAALETLRSMPRFAAIPVILVFNKNDPAMQKRAFDMGAAGYINRPFLGPILLKRVEAQLLVSSQRRRMEAQAEEMRNFNNSFQELVKGWTVLLEDESQLVRDLQSAVVGVMAEMVDCRDDVTGGHIDRTKTGVGMLLDGLQKRGLYAKERQGWDRTMVADASQLHDVGKIYISDTILQKPARLTEEEFNIMKKHTDYGNTIIDRIEAITQPNELTRHAKIFAGFHHERWDGKGYPLGIAGEEIPLQGRIMAVADVYDALVSKRPYKNAMSHEEAVKIIKAGRGTQFDPVLIDVFLADSDKFKSYYAATQNDNLMSLLAQAGIR